MGMPEGVPSSRAPTKTTPARPCPGRSLAKAHTAWRILSMGPSLPGGAFLSDSLRSTNSDSRSAIMASRSKSV